MKIVGTAMSKGLSKHFPRILQSFIDYLLFGTSEGWVEKIRPQLSLSLWGMQPVRDELLATNNS
jgi:hypothetical protein